MQIIVKQSYAHYNNTLGRSFKNKDEYDSFCKKNNWVSMEQAQELAEKGRREKIKNYKISKESKEIIEHAKNNADKKGNVKLSDRAIDKLIEKKAIGKIIPEYMNLPAAYSNGGYCK